MLTGHLGNVYIRKMPCSGCKTPTSLWGPWVGDRGEAWVGQGVLGGSAALGDSSQPSHLC